MVLLCEALGLVLPLKRVTGEQQAGVLGSECLSLEMDF